MSGFDLISDVSLITTLPYKTLLKICDKGAECLCHNVLEGIQNDENEIDIDISIGTIKILIEDEELHYRFVPSKRLEEMLITTVCDGNDPLVKHIEESLSARILNTYKDLI